MNNSEDKIYKNNGNEAVLDKVNGNNLQILDVGCGAGDNARILIKMNHQVDGVTHSQEEVYICSKFMRRVYLYDLSNGLPPEITGSYDYVICSHVLEHIAYPTNLLNSIKKVLKPTGSLIIALPNIMHYKSRIKLLFGVFEYQESGIWDNTHLRWYTFRSAQSLLEIHGFIIKEKWVDGAIPAGRIFKYLPINFKKLLFKLLNSISPGLFGSQILLKANLQRNG